MSKTVMVVDDDEAIRDALSSALEDEGYNVVCAEHGRAALDHLSQGGEHPCVIFLDLMMPIMDGWAFRSHQKQSPEYSEIPVVVITAAGSTRASTIDADRVLHKPLTFKTVIAALQEFCN